MASRSLVLLVALVGGGLLAGCTVPEEAAPAAPAPRVPQDADAADREEQGSGPASNRAAPEFGARRAPGGDEESGSAPLPGRADESPMRLYVQAVASPAEPCRRAPVHLAVAVEDAAGEPVEGANVTATWRAGAFAARERNATDPEGAVNLTRLAPARAETLVPIEVEATEGRRYGAAVAFFTVAECGSEAVAGAGAWLDEPWTEEAIPFPAWRNETLNEGASMDARCCP